MRAFSVTIFFSIGDDVPDCLKVGSIQLVVQAMTAPNKDLADFYVEKLINPFRHVSAIAMESTEVDYALYLAGQ